MQQQTATLQTAENSSTQTVEAETDSFVDCIHTGYSECSLDAWADLRNETSCKENRRYILISITIRASNTLSRSAKRKATPTTFALHSYSLCGQGNVLVLCEPIRLREIIYPVLVIARTVQLAFIIGENSPVQ